MEYICFNYLLYFQALKMGTIGFDLVKAKSFFCFSSKLMQISKNQYYFQGPGDLLDVKTWPNSQIFWNWHQKSYLIGSKMPVFENRKKFYITPP